MAASFGAATALAASSVTENAQKSSTYLPLCHRHFFYGSRTSEVSFRLSPRPKLRFSSKAVCEIVIAFLEDQEIGLSVRRMLGRGSGSKENKRSNKWCKILQGLKSGWNCSAVVRAELNEVAEDESSKTAASTPVKSEESLAEAKDVKLSNDPSPAALGSEESISEFISQVSSLIKLVDSKDIVELQLKQLDCELLVRKKEALPQPPAPATYVHSQPQPAVLPSVPTLSPVPTAAPSPASTPTPAPPKAQPSKSSHQPLKCPMAGTFYRSPAPGEPPFVKIGDKVQKGQVLCIIEAMKLMNEIETDRSGTLVEILAEDGKSVSVDTPLFVIEP